MLAPDNGNFDTSWGHRLTEMAAQRAIVWRVCGRFVVGFVCQVFVVVVMAVTVTRRSIVIAMRVFVPDAHEQIGRLQGDRQETNADLDTAVHGTRVR